MVEVQDWQAEALRLRDEEDASTSDVAHLVGKHPATIRKLFARNPVAETNGNGHRENYEVVLNGETVGHGPEGMAKALTTMVNAGQTDVYDHLPEDDPDHPGWAGKDEFTVEAGEAVGDMPKDPEPDPISHEIRLRGTEQLGWDFGPNSEPAASGTIVLKSEKLESGFFGVGDVITGTFTARVVSVTGAEKFDRDLDDFTTKPQAHTALITEVALKSSGPTI